MKGLPGPAATPEAPFHVLAAVSGGADSMCMLDLLMHVSVPVKVTVAHCNFHLRGEESDADEALVMETAAKYGAAFVHASFDTVSYASKAGISIEMAARELRYRFFAEQASTLGCAAVAVAHHADDNAETLILNLLRGTGVRGMCGMKAVSPLPVPGYGDILLIRPMLSFSRSEILSYDTARGVVFREDRTNADDAYKRNRIRNNVFPEFAALNPSYVRTLNRDMAHAAAVQAVADSFYETYRDRVMEGDSVDTCLLKTLPHWEYILYRILEEKGFREEAVSEAVEMVRTGRASSSRKITQGSLEIIGTGGRLVLGWKPALREGECLSVVEGEGVYALDGQRFLVEVKPWDKDMPLVEEGVVAMDAAKAGGFPFIVRHRNPGDWFRPLGMKGRKKLQDWMTDRHYSPMQKEETLVVRIPSWEDSRIAAVLGKTVDESVRISPGTGEAVVIKLLPSI